jgi:hypothetical protein
MTNRKRVFSAGAAICAATFAFAFIAAPKSCEWGLEAYALVGVVGVLLLIVLPFALRAGESGAARIGLGVALAAAGAVVWIVGLFAANVRIMCRLF